MITRRMVLIGALGVAAGTGTILMGAGLMATSGYLISRAALRPPIAELMLVFVAVRFFGLARPAVRYAERLASHDVTFRWLTAVRGWFVERLVRLSTAQLAAYRAGDLLSRLSADVDLLQESWLRVAAPAMVAAAATIIVVGALLTIDGTLAGAVLALLLFNGLVWSWVATRLEQGLGEARNRERRALSSDVVMLIQGMEDVLAMGYEGRVLSAISSRQRRLDSIETRYGWRLAMHMGIATVVTLTAFLVALALLVPAAEAGRLPIVWIAAVALGVVAAFEAVEGLPMAWQFSGQAAESARRVREVSAANPAVIDPPSGIALPRVIAPSLEFRDVTFGYGHAPILDHVTFRVEAGEHVAIVGSTGSGKSTLLELLTRGWDPQAGSVLIDGVDLRQVRIADLRVAAAVMPQHIHVFNTTLRENVRLARPTATDAELLDVLLRAELRELFATLGEGLDTVLGEHGARLSAGERRLLGFARILMTDAPLVLVDEPTAHLDGVRERALYNELTSWARSRTLVWVTHRPDALHFVDRIFEVRGGSVRQIVRQAGT